LIGTYFVGGDGDLEFGSGAITTIEAGSSLQLDGAQARVSIGAVTTNSALSDLSDNYGSLTLQGGNTGYGAGGTSVTTSVGLTNAGVLDLDNNGGNGGSSLTVGGTLDNYESATIGNNGLGAPTTVKASALFSPGSLTVLGNETSGTTNQATVDITGAASAALIGTYFVGGDGDLEFGSGAITAIEAGSSLQLDGAQARVSIGAVTTNSALSDLSDNYGSLTLQGDTGYGAGGTSVTTSVGLTNAGVLDLDNNGGNGGSSLTVGGTLDNTGDVTMGNGALSAPSTLTVGGLENSGLIGLSGSSTQLSEIVVNGSATNTGQVYLANGEFDLTGGRTYVQNAGTTDVLGGVFAASTIEVEGGVFSFEVPLTAGDGTGALDVSGAGIVNFGGAVDASHTVTFTGPTGTLQLSAPASFAGTIAGFSGNDVIDLTETPITGLTLSYSGQILTVTPASGPVAKLTFSGSYNGDDFFAVSDGATGTDILFEPAASDFWESGSGNWTPGDWSGGAPGSGANAIIESGSVTLNSAAAVKSVTLAPTASLSIVGASLTTTAAFTNAGTLDVDASGEDGGGSLTVGGALTNSGHATIGNTSLGGLTTAKAASLVNAGSLTVQGNSGGGTGDQATLDITGAAPTVLIGSNIVRGDADLEFGSGAITSISQASSLEIDGAEARISIGAGSTSSALSDLSDNYGTITLQGDTGDGAGGTSVTTTVGLTNAGTLDIDFNGGDGASSLTIGGALDNTATGSLSVGNTALGASTRLDATSLGNAGSLTVQGNDTSGTTDQATLAITGATSAALFGSVRVSGDADLEFGSGAITTIETGSSLELDGAQARVSIGAATTSSALSDLSENYGTLLLEGDTGDGAGGAALATTVGLNNTGTLEVDNDGGGGSTLTIGGTLDNYGSTTVGFAGLSAPTTLTASALVNTGSIHLWGDSNLGTTDQATLDITGAAPSTLTGSFDLHGDADLNFGSGAITSIAAGAYLLYDGAQSRVSVGGGAGNSAFDDLGGNDGTLDLEGDWDTGPGGTTITTSGGFNNGGNLDLDTYGSDGDSSMSIGGTLQNTGQINVGNDGLSNATMLSAQALVNDGTISLVGSSAHLGELMISGAATNNATIDIGAFSELDVAGGDYDQSDGATTVSGTGILAASTIDVSGGLVDFTAAPTSGEGGVALDISGSGVLEFGAAVDESHTVTFTGSTGTLELGAPLSFAGTIAKFADSDVIDLLDTSMTDLTLSYSTSTKILTVTNSSGTVATLTFSGSYGTDDFAAVSDGNGGVDILDPPVSVSPAPTSSAAAPTEPPANPSLQKFIQAASSFGADSGGAGPISVAERSVSSPMLAGPAGPHLADFQ
jgi:hypothetical protein